MKIGLDFDGVIADCAQLKAQIAYNLLGVSIPASIFGKEIVVGRKLLTVEQYREIQRVAYESREHGLVLQPVSGALHNLSRIILDGHSVLVVTARHGTALTIAEEWLHQQGLNLEIVGVGFDKSKATTVAGFDVFVDDKPKNLFDLLAVVPHRVLFDRGYNQHYECGDSFIRIGSWEELYQLLQLLEGDQ